MDLCRFGFPPTNSSQTEVEYRKQGVAHAAEIERAGAIRFVQAGSSASYLPFTVSFCAGASSVTRITEKCGVTITMCLATGVSSSRILSAKCRLFRSPRYNCGRIKHPKIFAFVIVLVIPGHITRRTGRVCKKHVGAMQLQLQRLPGSKHLLPSPRNTDINVGRMVSIL